MSWPASAVWAAAPSGLRLSPVYQNVALTTDEPSKHFALTLTNQTPVAQSFSFRALDFGSLNESGGVAFLGENESEFEKKHGLAAWMTLDQSAAVLAPGQAMQLGVTVTNAATLTPGGHYGAVLAEAKTAPTDKAGNSRVGVSEVLSGLVLLVKDGSAAPNLNLLGQELGSSWWRLPENIKMRFVNQGDTHVVPRGTVSVLDPTGRQVGRGALNEDSGIILPGATRQYQTGVSQVARSYLPGRYQVVTKYRYDGNDHVKTLATTFWYWQPAGAWAAVLLALAAATGWVWWWVVPRLHRHWRGRGR
jgi:hypothetical protein